MNIIMYYDKFRCKLRYRYKDNKLRHLYDMIIYDMIRGKLQCA